MPFGSSKAAILGASGGGTPVEFSGYDAISESGDYTYVTYASSGTVTCVTGGEIDLILIGGGGGCARWRRVAQTDDVDLRG